MKSIQIRNFFFGFFSLVVSTYLVADEPRWRMRARENYEQITVDLDGFKSRYQGFSHTINLWYENPWKWALGFATGPYLTSFPEKKDQTTNRSLIGEKIKLINHGIEYKRWLVQGLFVRPGLYYHQFNGNAPDGRDMGYGAMVGLGYEFKVGTVGIALEYSQRRLELLHKKWSVSSELVAIGFHFYSM